MSAVLVDANILIDVLTDDPNWGRRSASALEQVADSGELVINPVIFAEVSIAYDRIEDLDDDLPAQWFRREPLPFEAAFLAGKAFIRYRRAGGTRTSSLPDFFIGAHAAVRGYRLLTRDRGRYRTYFPSVELVEP